MASSLAEPELSLSIQCKDSIERIEQFIKKKKISKAKIHLVDFLKNVKGATGSINRTKIRMPFHLEDNQLKKLDQAYKSIYPNGVTFNNLNEWSIVCNMGWLFSKHELATFYFDSLYEKVPKSP